MDIERIKIVLLGPQGVGKSSLLQTFIVGDSSNSIEPTLGASFMSKNVKYKENQVRLDIWDTAGQEKYNSFARMYCRGARAVLLLYDVNDEDSLHHLKHWHGLLQNEDLEKDVKIFVVGNKIDKIQGNYLVPEEIKCFCEKIPANFEIISAKDNIGVNELFDKIAEKCVFGRPPAKDRGSLSINSLNHSKVIMSKQHEKKKCCG